MWLTQAFYNIPTSLLNRIYLLYITTYGNKYIATIEEIKDHDYLIYYVEENKSNILSTVSGVDNTNNSNNYNNGSDIKAFIIIDHMKSSEMIKIIGYDDSLLYKQRLYNKISKLLVTPGYIVKCNRSSELSKILRFNYRLVPVLELEDIEDMLEIDTSKEKIMIVNNFDINDEDAYVFKHYTGLKPNGRYNYVKEYLLFGISCSSNSGFVNMEMSGPIGERICIYDWKK